ncbi:MAG TPA: hypothetical protein VME68_01570 [Acidobacteriaceae bacterium]|nr:hypothetical protein [Acidobacteriaceae bacterium]
MEYPSSLPPFQQFILDCADLASKLDDLDLHNPCLNVPAVIADGWAQKDALLHRRQALSTSLIEEAWVEFMLDGLRARLTFLESHAASNPPNFREPAMPPVDPGMLR